MNTLQHPALIAIRKVTAGTLYEGDLFLVGGAVREELLMLPQSADLDLVTTRSSLELAEILTGISSIEPVVYARFGTALLRIADTEIELVTARAESYEELSRKPTVRAATLQEDAYRRDFTINALMVEIHSGQMLDLTGQGLKDLQNRVLRTPLDPIETFHDDPLRMLRAVRFRWKLDFQSAPGLYEAIQETRERLQIVSAERVRDELVKILLHPSAPEAFGDLMRLGLLDNIVPELREMVGCAQGKYHHLDVWDHSLLVLKNAWSTDLILNLSALFHDVGKPPTRTIDEKGNTRFFGHESLGAAMTQEILRRLKFSQKQVDEVALLVRNHMRLGSAPTFTQSAARRLLKDLDGNTGRLLELVNADMGGLKTGVATLDLQAVRDQIDEVRRAAPVDQLGSPLTGEEIMSITGLATGRDVGVIKNWLQELVLEGQLLPGDKTSAEALLRNRLHAGDGNFI